MGIIESIDITPVFGAGDERGDERLTKVQQYVCHSRNELINRIEGVHKFQTLL